MSTNNTKNGKGFEFACLSTFRDFLRKEGRQASVLEDAPYETARKCYESVGEEAGARFSKAAGAAVAIIAPLEPRLMYGKGSLVLSINPDSAAIGPDGDVRDVMCVRSTASGGEEWKIGFSCKHNHEALRHPRITEAKDFGKAWLGYPCGRGFLSRMDGIMEDLKAEEAKKTLWDEIPDKAEKYYAPILEAFAEETEHLCREHKDAPARFLGYFFGSDDFYKIIARESSRTTTVEGFNINGTLNRSAPEGHHPAATVKRLSLPSRLLDISPKTKCTGEKSKTTLVLTFDEGWAVGLRIHNKDKRVKLTGLAFDVELVGLATGMFSSSRTWE